MAKDYTFFKETKSGKEWYKGSIIVDNRVILNPSEKQLIKDGWNKYEIKEPELYKGDIPIDEDDDLKQFRKTNKECSNILRKVRDEIVYHYTTLEVLFKGIMSKNNILNDYVTFRAYSVGYMNDELEGKLFYNSFNKAEESSLIEKYGPNVINNEFYQKWRNNLSHNVASSRQYSFSTSFSKDSDSLPMWNYYGNNGRGICLGIDSNDIWNQGFVLYDCIYDIEEIDYLGTQSFKSNYLSYLFRLLPKDYHFSYEKECRIPLITSYPKKYIKTRRDIFYPVSYDIKDGYIVPYIEIYLPLSSVKEIVIGPSNNMIRTKESIYGWLHSALSNPKIKIFESKVPFVK